MERERVGNKGMDRGDGVWGNEEEEEEEKNKCLWTGLHPYMGMWEEEVAGELGDGNEG